MGGILLLEDGKSFTGEAFGARGTRVGEVVLLSVEYVGPRVGAELRDDGLWSMGIACLLILVYIAFRFSSRFAPGAVVALVHFDGLGAEGKREDLVAKADAEDGFA